MGTWLSFGMQYLWCCFFDSLVAKDCQYPRDPLQPAIKKKKIETFVLFWSCRYLRISWDGLFAACRFFWLWFLPHSSAWCNLFFSLFVLTAWCFFGFATPFLEGSLLLRVKVCCSSPGRWRTWKLCDTPTRFQVVFLCKVCLCLILLCPLEFLLGHPNVCFHIQRRFALQMRAILCIRLAFCLWSAFCKDICHWKFGNIILFFGWWVSSVLLALLLMFHCYQLPLHFQPAPCFPLQMMCPAVWMFAPLCLLPLRPVHHVFACLPCLFHLHLNCVFDCWVNLRAPGRFQVVSGTSLSCVTLLSTMRHAGHFQGTCSDVDKDISRNMWDMYRHVYT